MLTSIETQAIVKSNADFLDLLSAELSFLASSIHYVLNYLRINAVYRFVPGRRTCPRADAQSRTLHHVVLLFVVNFHQQVARPGRQSFRHENLVGRKFKDSVDGYYLATQMEVSYETYFVQR